MKKDVKFFLNLLIDLIKSKGLESTLELFNLIKVRSILLGAEEVYNTYLIRSRLHYDNEILSNLFSKLLSGLLLNLNREVMIHTITYNQSIALFIFLDYKNSELIGYLLFESCPPAGAR